MARVALAFLFPIPWPPFPVKVRFKRIFHRQGRASGFRAPDRERNLLGFLGFLKEKYERRHMGMLCLAPMRRA